MARSSFFLQFKTILEQRPLVVGTLSGRLELAKQIRRAVKARVDLIEIRLDSFPLPAAGAIIKTVRRLSAKPLLLTLRSPEEGGDIRFQRGLGSQGRGAFLRGILPLADMVDLELREHTVCSKLTKLAHSKGVVVAHSLHDFKRVPPAEFLNRMARRSLRLKGDFFKAAVMVNDPKKLREFLTWGAACDHPRPVLIAMGESGLVSRVLGYCFGSTMTFGHLGKAAAPGQMDAGRLSMIIGKIFKPLSRLP